MYEPEPETNGRLAVETMHSSGQRFEPPPPFFNGGTSEIAFQVAVNAVRRVRSEREQERGSLTSASRAPTANKHPRTNS